MPEEMRYSVEATNISQASENKIHDDAVAQKLGFAAALVPGVEVYAYACHLPVRRWGRAWLERGAIECRLLKPVYDGKVAIATAKEADGGLELSLESESVLCATGRASLGDGSRGPPSVEDYALRAPPASRPPADEESLAEGRVLCTAPHTVTREDAAAYLGAVREADAIFATEGLVHPGLLLRQVNLALRQNVVLQPWVHTGSAVRNFAVARVGDELSVRSRVAANYARKGHRLVDLDALIIANGRTAIAHVVHTAVYRLRQLAET